MFDLDKLIRMVKKGEFLEKPFNIRKKAGEEEFGEEYIRRTTDAPDVEQSYEQRIPGEEVKTKEDIKFDLPERETSEQKLKKVQIEKSMNEWVTQNAENMKMEAAEGVEALEQKRDNPKNSLLKTEKDLTGFLVDEMMQDPNLVSALSGKIDQVVGGGVYVSNLLVGTMLAKYKGEQEAIINAPAPVGPVRPIVGPVVPVATPDVAPVAPVDSGGDVMYDDITTKVLQRFNPTSLSENDEDWNSVLDSLRPKGKDKGQGVGQMYDVGKFTKAVEKMFGVPSQGKLDQRMNFFLVNSELLKMPFFPKEAPEKNVFEQVPGLEDALRAGLIDLGIDDPDVINGLKRTKSRTARESKSKSSPRSVMTNLLQLYAEPELHEILDQLIDRADPSVVRWFKTKLPYVDDTDTLSLTTDDEKSNLGIQKGVDPEKQVKRVKATPEQQKHSNEQISAIVDSYLIDQTDSMDIMNDSIVGSMVGPESNKYMELRNSFAQTQSPEEKQQIENKMQKQMNMYTLTESINGYGNYAVAQLKQLFKDAIGVTSGKQYLEPGSVREDTLINFRNKFGKASVMSDIKDMIFSGDKSKSEKVKPSDYVKHYIKRINNGEIADPYEPDWADMVNREVPYNAFADIYIVKAEIQKLYNEAIAKRSQDAYPVGKDDVVANVYNQLNSNPEDVMGRNLPPDKRLLYRKLLEDFSGMSFEDRGLPQGEQKKKSFIEMTVYQAEEKAKKDEKVRIEDERIEEIERIKKEELGDQYKRKLTERRKDKIDTYKKCYESRKKHNDERERIKNEPNLTEEEKRKELIKENLDEKEGPLTIKVDNYGNYVFDGDDLVWTRRGSILKQMKAEIGRDMWPILPGILKYVQNSEATNIFEQLAEKSFIDLFNHSSHQYNTYKDIGKKPNPFDELGRTNTELYYSVKEGSVPEDIQKIVDFSKAAKGTAADKKYVSNLSTIWGLKKTMRKKQQLVDKHQMIKDNHMVNNLNYKFLGILNKYKSEKNESRRDKMFKNVPPERLTEFKQTVFAPWTASIEFPDEYYLWLGLAGPVKSKNTYNATIKKHQASLDTTEGKIRDKEMANAEIGQQTTASSRPYFRMVYAEYKKALSKIDKLCKIKKFSYKFASVNVASIDDTILGIEKDFENLLDSLIR